MPLLLTALFALGFALVPGMAVFILRKNPASPLHRTFALACLSLMAWLGTLYAFDRMGEGRALTLVGRLNYASVLFVVLLGYLFVRRVLRRPAPNAHILIVETLLLAALTLLTPLVDRAEQGGARHALRPALRPLYVQYLVGYLLAALLAAFLGGRHAPSASCWPVFSRCRRQVRSS